MFHDIFSYNYVIILPRQLATQNLLVVRFLLIIDPLCVGGTYSLELALIAFFGDAGETQLRKCHWKEVGWYSPTGWGKPEVPSYCLGLQAGGDL